jgi:hypothetical protein
VAQVPDAVWAAIAAGRRTRMRSDARRTIARIRIVAAATDRGPVLTAV